MICYLIPNCKTCLNQERIFKQSPNPNINVRYISMSSAKKTPYKFPLWINGKKKYQGLLKMNSFGSVPTLGEVFSGRCVNKSGLCPMLQRPGGPCDTYNQIWKSTKTLENNRKNFPDSKLANGFGKKSCFGKPLILGGGNSIKEQKMINNINRKVGQKLKSSAIKAGGKGSLTAAGIKNLKKNVKGIKITKDATGTTLTLRKK